MARSWDAASGVEAAEPEVSIVIPTFQRPDDLRDALRSCLTQRANSGRPFEIVVVDNSSDGSAAPVVAGLEPGIIPVRYVHEPRPGISRARNAGFANARGRFLALIDDDERASPDWLAHLTRAQRTCGADVVFGPVYPEFDPLPERDLRFLTQFYTYTLKKPTGTPVGERSTNNALVRRACVRAAEPFVVDLGLTGGEDTLFFSQLRTQGGARFVWSAEAFVIERNPTRANQVELSVATGVPARPVSRLDAHAPRSAAEDRYGVLDGRWRGAVPGAASRDLRILADRPAARALLRLENDRRFGQSPVDEAIPTADLQPSRDGPRAATPAMTSGSLGSRTRRPTAAPRPRALWRNPKARGPGPEATTTARTGAAPGLQAAWPSPWLRARRWT